ncbi:MAG: hypothetical protein AAB263_14310, partial [Planctomycetota bacterium]
LPYSTNPDSNVTALGTNIAELCAAGSINNAIRILMADLTTWYNAAQPLIATIAAKQPGNAVLTALAGAGAAANQIAVYTGSDQAGLTPLTPFMQTVLDDADSATACVTLGAVRVASMSLANPGYIRFQISGIAPFYFQIAFGSAIFAPGSNSVNYHTAFPNVSFCVLSAGGGGPAEERNNPGVSATSASGFTAFSTLAGSTTGWYIAIGF